MTLRIVRPRDEVHHAEGDEYNRLFEAACILQVDADLQVKVESHRHGDATAAPRAGEAADVTVTTCDAQGKPVSAEVSLALLPAERADRDFPVGQWLPHTRARRPVPDGLQYPVPLSARESRDWHGRTRRGCAGRAGAYCPAGRNSGRHSSAVDDPFADSRVADPFGDSPAAIPAAICTAPTASVPSAHRPIPLAMIRRSRGTGAASPRRLNLRSEPDSAVSRFLRPTWSGYWNPAITTGPDGRATISLTLPDDAADLTLVAKAITPDTLTGQLSQNLVLKKDLSAVIHLPSAFTDGDEVELPVVVENQVLDQGTLEVTLNANVDGVEWTSEKKILDVKSRGRLETSFKTTIRQVQRPAQKADSCPCGRRRSLPLRSRLAHKRRLPPQRADSALRHALSRNRHGHCQRRWPRSRSRRRDPIGPRRRCKSPSARRFSGVCWICLHPSDLARHGGMVPTATMHPWYGGHSRRQRFDGRVGLDEFYPADSPERRMLDERIDATLSLLIAGQHDGAWSIDAAGRQALSPPTPWPIGRWCLPTRPVSTCRRRFSIPALRRLRGTARGNQEGDLETKAIVLHALAISGQGDFALANHLLATASCSRRWGGLPGPGPAANGPQGNGGRRDEGAAGFVG